MNECDLVVRPIESKCMRAHATGEEWFGSRRRGSAGGDHSVAAHTMATKLLLFAIILMIATSTLAQRERGREVRRRNRQFTTTTTLPPPMESTTEQLESPETSEGGEDKQNCEGEPGCEWRCADQPDPSASCTCFCAPPENNKEEGSYDGSYFN